MDQPPADRPITSISKPGVKAGRDELYAMRKRVAALLGRRSTNFPGAQPVSFAREHLNELTRKDYYVCEKSDGIRYLLYVASFNNTTNHYLIDRKNDFWYIPNQSLHFPASSTNVAIAHNDTLIDGELVWDATPSGEREPRYLMFDCLAIQGDQLFNKPLDKRLAYLQERFYEPYKRYLQTYPEEVPYQPFLVEMKPFQLAYGVEMMFKEVLPSLKHGNDGLVFTCRTSDYKPGTDPHIVKWKPPEENTIDFRLRLNFPTVEPDEAEKAEGITEPFIDYDSVPPADLLIFNGDSGEELYSTFDALYITEEEWETLKGLGDPLNDRIAECNLDEQGRWRLVRFRDDKSEANHRSTVTSVMESIKDRVGEKDLYNISPLIRENWKARQAREKTGQPARPA